MSAASSDALLPQSAAVVAVGADGLPEGFAELRRGLTLFLHYSGLRDQHRPTLDSLGRTSLSNQWCFEALDVRRDCAAAYQQLGTALAAAKRPAAEVAAAHAAAAAIAAIEPDRLVMRQLDAQMDRIAAEAKRIILEEDKAKQASERK